MTPKSVAGIAIRAGKFLAAKRREGGAIGLCWEFPGGKVEHGETEEAALKREFLEELGVEVTPLRRIGTVAFSCGSGSRILAAWLVSLRDDIEFELREHSEARWHSLTDLAALDLADSDRKLLDFLRPDMN